MGKSLNSLGPDAKLVNFRATPEMIERWKEDAYQHRMPFSRWIRHCLDNGAEGTQMPVRTLRVPLPRVSADPTPPLVTLAQELVKAKRSTSTTCERRLPKGAFCKSCGRIHP